MRLALVLLAPAALLAQAGLRLEATIELPRVEGRIDHFSIDLKGRRLFMAALGNNTVEVIDLAAHKPAYSIRGLAEPQGVLYLPGRNRLYVASGQDGTCRIYDAASWQLLKTVKIGDDPDNIRYDASARTVWVGYGGDTGGLFAMTEDGEKTNDIRLDAHAESFQLERGGSRIFVNVPKARQVAAVDRARKAVTAKWQIGAEANFPMALDEAHHRLFIGARKPAELVVLDSGSGGRVAKLPIAGDCDDLFFDVKRGLIYAIGGEGAVSIVRRGSDGRYTEAARVPTAKGARTGFFSPDLDRLFVAARRDGSKPARVLVFAPAP